MQLAFGRVGKGTQVSQYSLCSFTATTLPPWSLPWSHLFWREVCEVHPLVWIWIPPLCTSPSAYCRNFPHSTIKRCLIQDKIDGGNRNLWWERGCKTQGGEIPFSRVGNKARVDPGRKELKTIPTEASEKWCSFFSRGPRSHSLSRSLHGSSTAMCRERRTAAQFSKLVKSHRRSFHGAYTKWGQKVE